MATRKPSDPPRTAGQAAKAAMAQVLRERVALWANLDKELGRLIDAALAAIVAQLARAPADYQQWVLPRLAEGVQRVADALQGQLAIRGADGLRQAWQLGERAVTLPIGQAAAFEMRVAPLALVPSPDLRQLLALQAMNTHRIVGATAELVQKVNHQLGMVALGVQTPHQAMQVLQAEMPDRTAREVRGIVTTNLGTAFNTASWQALKAQAARDPAIKKQWRRSGKLHSRWNHDQADGQVQPVDEPFSLQAGNGKGTVSLMYPADPAAPVGEVIHCGCVALPWKEGWKMRVPAARAFSPAEVKARKDAAARKEGKRISTTRPNRQKRA